VAVVAACFLFVIPQDSAVAVVVAIAVAAGCFFVVIPGGDLLVPLLLPLSLVFLSSCRDLLLQLTLVCPSKAPLFPRKILVKPQSLASSFISTTYAWRMSSSQFNILNA
jgi:hypothetical protein